MAGDKLDVQHFFASPLAVAAAAAANEVFGLLSRKVKLPPGVAALVRREQGDHRLCPAGGGVDSEGVVEVLFVRTTPIDLSWTEERLFSADKFEARATVNLRVSPVADRGELLSFHNQILGSDRTADRRTLVRYLQTGVRPVLSRLAEERKAEALVDAEDRQAVAEAIAEALAGPCFAAGLQVETSPVVTFESPTYRQVRLTEEQAAKHRQEHAAGRQLELAIETAQRDHLQHLEELLDKLRSLAEEAPDVDLADLARTFSESERGEVYEALFAASTRTRSTQWIVVAAGTELLFYDPVSGEGPLRTIALGGEVGPVRSVQFARDPDGTLRLLAGAARGVYAVAAQADTAPMVYPIDQPGELRGGVNSVALSGDAVLASHSEVGLIRWQWDKPDWPVRLLENLTREARAVRNVCFHDGRIYCSVDQTVLAMEADRPTESNVRVYAGSDSLITAVCPAGDGVYAGNADGQILFWPDGGAAAAVSPPLTEVSPVKGPQRIHSGPPGAGRPVESVHLLTVGGVSRLIFTDTSLAVHARVIGDTFTCRYEAGGQTLRRVEVAPDLIVATNEVRDRLILWSPGSPAAPSGTITVARQIGHSVQDVCLLPMA